MLSICILFSASIPANMLSPKQEGFLGLQLSLKTDVQIMNEGGGRETFFSGIATGMVRMLLERNSHPCSCTH